MRDIDERIQLISTELLPSLVVTPDGCVSEADIRYVVQPHVRLVRNWLYKDNPKVA